MEEKKKVNPTVVKILSVAMALIGIVACILAVRIQKEQQPFGLGDYSGTDISVMEEQFEFSGSNSDLVELLKALCYKAEVEEDKDVVEDIAVYGSELFDRAKAGEADLSTLDDEAVMLELIGIIKDYGAE